MSEFYTNVALRGDKILLRGYRNGIAIKETREFHPTLFVPSKKKTDYTTLDGSFVESINPGTVRECRSFIEKYKSVTGFEILGNTDYIYQFIGDNFKGDIDYDYSSVKIASVDIETTCENGFPDVNSPAEQIIAITVSMNGEKHVLGLGKFSIPDVNCYEFETEEDLLTSFIQIWEELEPDIITGWNIRFFDIPYLVNRITHLFGESVVRKLSPWRQIKSREVTKMGRTQTVHELVGVTTYDYYELYTTFTYVNQESYKLDHIAFVELGEKKLSYDEYDSMSDFYKNDFQKFMEYNVKDVDLVSGLEDKMKLIELAIALAYTAKVNFMDVFGQVRTWDCIIYHYLMEHNVIIPAKTTTKKDAQYAGAYVKDPIVGMHDWVVSFDLNSLYPHLIMHYNISPETKIKQPKDFMITPDAVLGEQSEQVKRSLKLHTDKNYSIAANGTCYTKEHQGFLPALMEKLYKERSMYKKKMIDCQKRQQAGEKNLEKDIAKYNNFQLVRKIQLNSAYGAIGNEWFRYFDVDMAEAITLSGQLSIRWIADKLNEFMNTTIGTEDYDYVVASDTDSVYLRCGNLVDKVCGGKSKSEVVEFLDKAAEEVILPYIKKQYDELTTTMNAYDNKMVMDRECIADKGVWTAKKRYMMQVFDSEGIRYDEPKLKIMGIETTRSSTPQVVRDSLKQAIKLILTTDESTVIEFINNFRNKFNSFSAEEIAFPRGVNGLRKYIDKTNIYGKSTPIAVKGALIYNHYLKQQKLSKKYPLINEGDKIKFLYLKTPNPCGGQFGVDQVLSFPGEIPKEFGLGEFFDYDKQFEKAFLDPLKNILNSIDWSHEERSTLEGLFV